MLIKDIKTGIGTFDFQNNKQADPNNIAMLVWVCWLTAYMFISTGISIYACNIHDNNVKSTSTDKSIFKNMLTIF